MLRTYGRTYNEDGTYQWVVVETDANGFNDNVYLTTLCQNFRLNLGESPMFANYGIPAQQSVVTQVIPDFYVAQTQAQFSPYFSALAITRDPLSNPPNYNVEVIYQNGAIPDLSQVPM